VTGAQQTPWAGIDFFGSFFIFEKRVVRIIINCLYFYTKSKKMSEENRLKKSWEEVQQEVSAKFGGGEILDVDSIIFLIGIQELGKGYKNYSKDEKLNIMHIAICRLLVPFGYYKFDFYDEDGWPHYKALDELPQLKPGEQTVLMKEAIVMYFEKE